MQMMIAVNTHACMYVTQVCLRFRTRMPRSVWVARAACRHTSMHLCVCVCMYVYMYIYICMYVCMYVCMYMYMYIHA